MSMPARIRVMIVDDHAIVREGLESVIGKQPDMIVVSSVATGEDALSAYEGCRPDVVLLDLRLPGKDGLATLGALLERDRRARVVMLSSHEGDQAIRRALRAGALGYVFKSMLSDELLVTIRKTVTGKVPIAAEVARRLGSTAALPDLSDREVEILRRVAQGLGNKEIAEELGLSTHTVKNHVNNIMVKLGAADRTQAVTLALQRGIMDLDGPE